MEVPASASGETTVQVVGYLNAAFATSNFQSRTKCSAPTSGAVVTFSEVLLAPGDATVSAAPTLAPTLHPGACPRAPRSFARNMP